MKLIKFFLIIFSIGLMITSCKKEEFAFGEIKAPANLTVSATVIGNSTDPNGDGSGMVDLKSSADNALSYKIDMGNGDVFMSATGDTMYKYTTPDTNTYTIIVSAIGKAGVITSASKTVKVYVAFQIPGNILDNVTGGSSKVWITAHDDPGHFGVGPNAEFSPIWYAAGPNTRDACAYDDEITFTKTATGGITINVDNKGQTFSIGAATGFYGLAGGDGCYDLNTGGTKPLSFMAASSGSNTSNSTGIQFKVPGNGIVNFGTGGTTYEILSLTADRMHLRNIGADGNAWYQILMPKP